MRASSGNRSPARTAASTRSRAGPVTAAGWSGRHSRPVGQQLLVEAVGRGRGVGGAAPLQPPGAAGHAPAALLHQAGLAEPGLAGHQHDRAVTARRFAQGRAERGQFGLPSDQRAAGAEPVARDARHGRAQVGGRSRPRPTRPRRTGARRRPWSPGRPGPNPAWPAPAARPPGRRPRPRRRTRPGRRRRWDRAPPGRSPPRSAGSLRRSPPPPRGRGRPPGPPARGRPRAPRAPRTWPGALPRTPTSPSRPAPPPRRSPRPGSGRSRRAAPPGRRDPSAATSAASTLTVLSSSRAGACVRGGPASKAAVAYTSSSHGDRPSPSSPRAARQRS